jgi:hypothetical protein
LAFEPEPAQSKLALVNTTEQSNASYGDGSGFVTFETKHRSNSELDPTMVLFDKSGTPGIDAKLEYGQSAIKERAQSNPMPIYWRATYSVHARCDFLT